MSECVCENTPSVVKDINEEELRAKIARLRSMMYTYRCRASKASNEEIRAHNKHKAESIMLEVEALASKRKAKKVVDMDLRRKEQKLESQRRYRENNRKIINERSAIYKRDIRSGRRAVGEPAAVPSQTYDNIDGPTELDVFDNV